MKDILAVEIPFFHHHSSRRLLSKFQGPLFSTHSSWNLELNLNCKMSLPTSTILRSKPIFHATHRVFLRALRFCWWLERSFSKRLREHSSRRSTRLEFEIQISSSSSVVNYSFWSPFRIDASMDEWVLGCNCCIKVT